MYMLKLWDQPWWLAMNQPSTMHMSLHTSLIATKCLTDLTTYIVTTYRSRAGYDVLVAQIFTNKTTTKNSPDSKSTLVKRKGRREKDVFNYIMST